MTYRNHIKIIWNKVIYWLNRKYLVYRGTAGTLWFENMSMKLCKQLIQNDKTTTKRLEKFLKDNLRR